MSCVWLCLAHLSLRELCLAVFSSPEPSGASCVWLCLAHLSLRELCLVVFSSLEPLEAVVGCV